MRGQKINHRATQSATHPCDPFNKAKVTLKQERSGKGISGTLDLCSHYDCVVRGPKSCANFLCSDSVKHAHAASQRTVIHRSFIRYLSMSKDYLSWELTRADFNRASHTVILAKPWCRLLRASASLRHTLDAWQYARRDPVANAGQKQRGLQGGKHPAHHNN
eukprot:3203944-Amphidinium_carterae.1